MPVGRTSSPSRTCPSWARGFQGQGYAFLALTQAMLAGGLKGLFCFGQNPAVGGANARLIRAGLDKLEWMVVADLFEHETASFWKRPGVDPTRIPTEVFVLPAASGVEKEGSIVNSGRWAQWRFRAVKPIADCRPDLDIVDGLARALKRAYEKDGVFPEPIRHLAWDYGGHEADPHMRRARAERSFSGRGDPAGGTRVPPASRCPASPSCGTTAAPCRVTGSTVAATPRRATWPLDATRPMRRTASGSIPKLGVGVADEPPHPVQPRLRQPQGRAVQPAQVGHPLERGKDGVGGRRSRRRHGAGASRIPSSCWPRESASSISPDLVDGPFPEHYEPVESPVRNLLSKRPVEPLRADLAVLGVRQVRHARRSFPSSPPPTGCPSTGRPAR